MQAAQSLTISLIFIFSFSALADVGIIKVAVPTNLKNVDPVKMWSTSEMILVSAYCRPLSKINQDGDIEGELLKSWSVSKDFKEYNFHLRENVKFHDGSNLTSEDVVNSLSRHYWRKFDSGYRHHLAFFIGSSDKIPSGSFLSQFKITGRYSFKLKTVKPYLPLLKMLSQTGLCIVKKDYPYIGTGPMKVKKHPSGNGWLLSRFDNYSGVPSKANHVHVYSEFDSEKGRKQVDDGTLDIAIGSLFTNSARVLPENRKLLSSVSINHFMLNHQSNLFKERKIRQAFGQLLQSLAWKEENIPWNQKPSKSIVPTGFFSYTSTSKNLTITETIRNLKKVIPKIKSPVRIALIGKHFSSSFIENLKQTFKDAKVPFIFKDLEASEWSTTFSSKDFDITHLPMQPSFYDPDGLFITLKNHFPNRLHYLFQNMTKFRNSINKKDRAQGYIKGLGDIENTWILVPAYRKYAPYLSAKGVHFPNTKFKNELEIWNVQKIKRGSNAHN